MRVLAIFVVGFLAWASASSSHRNFADVLESKSPFAQHHVDFLSLFEKMFTYRLAGPEGVKRLLAITMDKYNMAEAAMKAQKEKLGSFKYLFYYALSRSQLKKALEYAKDKIESLQNQVDHDDVMKSSYAQYITQFQDYVNDLLAKKSTNCKPKFDYLKSKLERKFDYEKRRMERVLPRNASADDKSLYAKALQLLESHRGDGEKQLKEWESQLKNEKDDKRSIWRGSSRNRQSDDNYC